MHPHSSTSSGEQTEVDPPTVEQVLIEATKQLPVITLAGCLTVAAEVLPYALGQVRPLCVRTTETGSHEIPTQFVWKDLETNEVYCHLRCAAIDAIVKASSISIEERIVDA